MKIAQKLGLLVGSLLVAVLATILLLSAQIGTTSKEYQDLINGQVAQRAASRTMQVQFGLQVLAFHNVLLLATDAADFARLKALYEQQDVVVSKLNDTLLANVGPEDPRLRTTLEEFKSTHAAVNTQYEASMDAFVASGYTDIAGASAAAQGQERFPDALIDYIIDYRARSVTEAIGAQEDAVSLRLKLIYGVGALLLLLAAAAVTLVVRGIVKPIRSLTAAALDAATNRLPQVVAQIAALPADAKTPTLPEFQVTTKDELAELATALTSLQDSAVGLALDQRRNEQSNSETLVNLGRRNQSLLTRMLSYVTELERDERDSEVLDKLFRLDHLTTRIRRNAESLLVLAGAKQTRTWSQPIAIGDVLRAALSEIEEYTRVTVHHADFARVHGGVAADLTHMLAELLENATRFSPRTRQVLVVGRLTPSGYQFDIIDAGLGMSEEELEAANSRITQAGQRRADTKVLGHHVVGRIASRRGIFVRLLPSVRTGITAQVLVPVALLSDIANPAGEQSQPAAELAPEQAEIPAPIAPSVAAPVAPSAAPVAAPAPAAPAPAPAPAPASSPAYQPQPLTQPDLQPQQQLPAPRPEPVPDYTSAGPSQGLPGRRVRGAQLEAFVEPEQQIAPAVSDPNVTRSQMSSLQAGVAAARREYSPQPIPYAPATIAADGNPVPTRRVRGAQLAELGADNPADEPVPPRDPAAIGRQLTGLQASTARARFESAQQATNDDTFGRDE